MLLKRFIILCFVLVLGGCYNVTDSVKPLSKLLDQVPEGAPENYRQGWLDGCNSGMASMTNSYYRTFYKYTRNPEFSSDPLYKKVWFDTYTFCRHYAYGNIREGNQRMRKQNDPVPGTFLFSEGILSHGFANFWGPGNGEFFGNFGEVAGSGDFLKGGGVFSAWGKDNSGILNSNE